MVYGVSPSDEINKRYYESFGMSIDSILARSDLYEKEGKNPHAYCTDIDRQGDVRVFANIRPNDYWMGTMLHELGHVLDQLQLQAPIRAHQRVPP